MEKREEKLMKKIMFMLMALLLVISSSFNGGAVAQSPTVSKASIDPSIEKALENKATVEVIVTFEGDGPLNAIS